MRTASSRLKFARNSRGIGSRILLASAAICAPSTVLAQVAPPPLPPPGSLRPPTREEVTRPEPKPPIQRGPQLEVEGGVERGPCALDGPEYQSIRLTLRAVEFEGLQGMTAQELAASYAPYVGQDVPISVVCDIRDRAGKILRDAGYIAAVQVPEQRIEDGVIRFKVLMAHLTQVRVRGDATGAERIIAGYLGHLTKQPVFNRFDAERYLLLASDIPGYSVRLTLRPAGTVPGEVVGDVTVQRLPAYADFNVQNLGSEELGRFGGLLRGQLYGLTGLGDRTTLSVFSTADFHEQQTLQLGHDFRIGSQGLTVGSSFTYSWARPDVPDANILAKTLLGNVEVDYPFIRRQSHSLRGGIGFDYINQKVDLDHADLTEDKLRVGYLALTLDAAKIDFHRAGYTSAEPPWRLYSQVMLRQGLHIFGATKDCGKLGQGCIGPGKTPPSRIEGQSNATELRFQGYGELRPIPRLTFALNARAQYAWEPLLSFEEFAAGNYTAGRGYDPGTLLGDKGFGTQAEIRYGSRYPVSEKKVGVEGYAFWDHAKVSNEDDLFVVDQSDHLNSVGAGARIGFNRFTLDAAIAVPLTRVGFDDKKPDPRFLISLNTRLWPWSYQ